MCGYVGDNKFTGVSCSLRLMTKKWWSQKLSSNVNVVLYSEMVNQSINDQRDVSEQGRNSHVV